MDNARFREILAGVPETRLRVLGLARELIDEDGNVRLDEAMAATDEIERARRQAHVYSGATGRLRRVLEWRISPRPR